MHAHIKLSKQIKMNKTRRMCRWVWLFLNLCTTSKVRFSSDMTCAWARILVHLRFIVWGLGSGFIACWCCCHCRIVTENRVCKIDVHVPTNREIEKESCAVWKMFVCNCVSVCVCVWIFRVRFVKHNKYDNSNKRVLKSVHTDTHNHAHMKNEW